VPSRYFTDQPLTTRATAIKSNHIGAGCRLIDKHQACRVKEALLSHPATACLFHIVAILLGRAKALLLKCNIMALKESPNGSAAAWDPRLRMASTISSSVQSGCSAIRANSQSLCFPNGEVLPPHGFAATLPVPRLTHFITELGLKSKRSAASRLDAPISTASITRARKSTEHGLGTDPPPTPESLP